VGLRKTRAMNKKSYDEVGKDNEASDVHRKTPNITTLKCRTENGATN
jgi:hypothetical protein